MNDDENLVSIGSDDPEMSEAIAKARSTLRQFLDTFFYPQRNQTNFLLKVRFEDSGACEHIWLADLNLLGDPPTGIVANESNLPGIKFMQRISFNPAEVSDWMFKEDDQLIGGFTTRLLKPSTRTN